LIFLEDTGMSSGVGDSQGAVLHITGNQATAICFNGNSAVIWDTGKHAAKGKIAPCN
jgi:hypothetical protein